MKVGSLEHIALLCVFYLSVFEANPYEEVAADEEDVWGITWLLFVSPILYLHSKCIMSRKQVKLVESRARDLIPELALVPSNTSFPTLQLPKLMPALLRRVLPSPRALVRALRRRRGAKQRSRGMVGALMFPESNGAQLTSRVGWPEGC